MEPMQARRISNVYAKKLLLGSVDFVNRRHVRRAVIGCCDCWAGRQQTVNDKVHETSAQHITQAPSRQYP
jgi:hypothetical protein